MAANRSTGPAKHTAEKTPKETKTMAEDASKSFQENADRIKEFNASMSESTKAANQLAIDNYETAAKNFFDMQRQLAGASQSEWVKATTNSQIKIGEQVTDAWVKAARDLLK